MKIAICVPVYGDTKAKFTQSLANMIIHFMSAQILDPDGKPVTKEIELFMVSCSMLTESRHKLVAEALTWGADYMLFLDADHVFPDDTLVRLLQHNLPIVGCNYARRFTPTAPTAAVLCTDGTKELLYTTQELFEARKVDQVAHMGFGICLINMAVFDVLQAHIEKKGEESFLPLFMFQPTEDKIGMIGEDVYFFGKMADAGIYAYVDHALSWHVGHLDEQMRTNWQAVQQKDQWRIHYENRTKKMKARIEELEAAA